MSELTGLATANVGTPQSETVSGPDRSFVLTEALPDLAVQSFETPSAIQRAAYLILNPWKNWLIPASWLKAFVSRSPSSLVAESFVSPGGWRSMEYLYRKRRPVDWIDRQALIDNPLSMAARNRRKIVTERLEQLIRRHPAAAPLTFLGIGSGPGWHIQTALRQSGIASSRVTAYLIDMADDSFEYGSQIASHFGLSDSVHFLQGDARKIRETLPGLRVDIAKLIGIVEYLNDDQALELLNAVSGVMVPGGHLIVNGIVDKYGIAPFLDRVFGLRHYKRDERHLKVLLENAGFRVVQSEYDPSGIHPILTAVRVDG